MTKTNEDINITVDTVLFFDMDGTLVDTNLANFFSYRKAIQSVTKSDYNLSYNPDNRFNRNSLKTTVPNLSETEYAESAKEIIECLRIIEEEVCPTYLNQE